MHCFGLPGGLPKPSHTDIALIALERVRTGAANAVLLLIPVFLRAAEDS